MTTPNDIDILIHYHVSASPHPRINAPAVQETLKRYVADGILVAKEGNYYDTTVRGKAWVEMILKTPYPRLVWVDDKGCEVLDEKKSPQL